MQKTMSITTRVSPEIKAEAEIIAQKLGINLSEAISMFLAQFVSHKGMPFEVTTDQFYSPSHVAYLERKVAEMSIGKKVYHEIIEEN